MALPLPSRWSEPPFSSIDCGEQSCAGPDERPDRPGIGAIDGVGLMGTGMAGMVCPVA